MSTNDQHIDPLLANLSLPTNSTTDLFEAIRCSLSWQFGDYVDDLKSVILLGPTQALVFIDNVGICDKFRASPMVHLSGPLTATFELASQSYSSYLEVTFHPQTSLTAITSSIQKVGTVTATYYRPESVIVSFSNPEKALLMKSKIDDISIVHNTTMIYAISHRTVQCIWNVTNAISLNEFMIRLKRVGETLLSAINSSLATISDVHPCVLYASVGSNRQILTTNAVTMSSSSTTNASMSSPMEYISLTCCTSIDASILCSLRSISLGKHLDITVIAEYGPRDNRDSSERVSRPPDAKPKANQSHTTSSLMKGSSLLPPPLTISHTNSSSSSHAPSVTTSTTNTTSTIPPTQPKCYILWDIDTCPLLFNTLAKKEDDLNIINYNIEFTFSKFLMRYTNESLSPPHPVPSTAYGSQICLDNVTKFVFHCIDTDKSFKPSSNHWKDFAKLNYQVKSFSKRHSTSTAPSSPPSSLSSSHNSTSAVSNASKHGHPLRVEVEAIIKQHAHSLDSDSSSTSRAHRHRQLHNNNNKSNSSAPFFCIITSSVDNIKAYSLLTNAGFKNVLLLHGVNVHRPQLSNAKVQLSYTNVRLFHLLSEKNRIAISSFNGVPHDDVDHPHALALSANLSNLLSIKHSGCYVPIAPVNVVETGGEADNSSADATTTTTAVGASAGNNNNTGNESSTTGSNNDNNSSNKASSSTALAGRLPRNQNNKNMPPGSKQNNISNDNNATKQAKQSNSHRKVTVEESALKSHRNASTHQRTQQHDENDESDGENDMANDGGRYGNDGEEDDERENEQEGEMGLGMGNNDRSEYENILKRKDVVSIPLSRYCMTLQLFSMLKWGKDLKAFGYDLSHVTNKSKLSEELFTSYPDVQVHVILHKSRKRQRILVVPHSKSTAEEVYGKVDIVKRVIHALNRCRKVHRLFKWKLQHRLALMGSNISQRMMYETCSTVVFHYAHNFVSAEIVALTYELVEENITILDSLNPTEGVHIIPQGTIFPIKGYSFWSDLRYKFGVYFENSVNEKGTEIHAWGFGGLVEESFSFIDYSITNPGAALEELAKARKDAYGLDGGVSGESDGGDDDDDSDDDGAEERPGNGGNDGDGDGDGSDDGSDDGAEERAEVDKEGPGEGVKIAQAKEDQRGRGARHSVRGQQAVTTAADMEKEMPFMFRFRSKDASNFFSCYLALFLRYLPERFDSVLKDMTVLNQFDECVSVEINGNLRVKPNIDRAVSYFDAIKLHLHHTKTEFPKVTSLQLEELANIEVKYLERVKNVIASFSSNHYNPVVLRGLSCMQLKSTYIANTKSHNVIATISYVTERRNVLVEIDSLPPPMCGALKALSAYQTEAAEMLQSLKSRWSNYNGSDVEINMAPLSAVTSSTPVAMALSSDESTSIISGLIQRKDTHTGYSGRDSAFDTIPKGNTMFNLYDSTDAWKWLGGTVANNLETSTVSGPGTVTDTPAWYGSSHDLMLFGDDMVSSLLSDSYGSSSLVMEDEDNGTGAWGGGSDLSSSDIQLYSSNANNGTANVMGTYGYNTLPIPLDYNHQANISNLVNSHEISDANDNINVNSSRDKSRIIGRLMTAHASGKDSTSSPTIYKRYLFWPSASFRYMFVAPSMKRLQNTVISQLRKQYGDALTMACPYREKKDPAICALISSPSVTILDDACEQLSEMLSLVEARLMYMKCVLSNAHYLELTKNVFSKVKSIQGKFGVHILLSSSTEKDFDSKTTKVNNHQNNNIYMDFRFKPTSSIVTVRANAALSSNVSGRSTPSDNEVQGLFDEDIVLSHFSSHNNRIVDVSVAFYTNSFYDPSISSLSLSVLSSLPSFERNASSWNWGVNCILNIIDETCLSRGNSGFYLSDEELARVIKGEILPSKDALIGKTIIHAFVGSTLPLSSALSSFDEVPPPPPGFSSIALSVDVIKKNLHEVIYRALRYADEVLSVNGVAVVLPPSVCIHNEKVLDERTVQATCISSCVDYLRSSDVFSISRIVLLEAITTSHLSHITSSTPLPLPLPPPPSSRSVLDTVSSSGRGSDHVEQDTIDTIVHPPTHPPPAFGYNQMSELLCQHISACKYGHISICYNATALSYISEDVMCQHIPLSTECRGCHYFLLVGVSENIEIASEAIFRLLQV